MTNELNALVVLTNTIPLADFPQNAGNGLFTIYEYDATANC